MELQFRPDPAPDLRREFERNLNLFHIVPSYQTTYVYNKGGAE